MNRVKKVSRLWLTQRDLFAYTRAIRSLMRRGISLDEAQRWVNEQMEEARR